MSWTNTFTREIRDQLPPTLEYQGQTVDSATLSINELSSIGWFKLKPMIMPNEVINPQWAQGE